MMADSSTSACVSKWRQWGRGVWHLGQVRGGNIGCIKGCVCSWDNLRLREFRAAFKRKLDFFFNVPLQPTDMTLVDLINTSGNPNHCELLLRLFAVGARHRCRAVADHSLHPHNRAHRLRFQVHEQGIPPPQSEGNGDDLTSTYLALIALVHCNVQVKIR